MIFSANLFSSGILAQKVGYKMKKAAKKETRKSVSSIEITDSLSSTDDNMASGSFMVASQCPTCNNGYNIGQVVFTGFDKNQNNAKESFFIINNTDRTLTGVAFYIDYRTLDGRQLTKRFIKLDCDIPAGETRKADIRSWDTQRSFYYHKSVPSKRRGNAFDITFDPIAYYLRF